MIEISTIVSIRKIKFSLPLDNHFTRTLFLLIGGTKESNIESLCSYCNAVAPFTTPIVTIQASFYEIHATTSLPPSLFIWKSNAHIVPASTYLPPPPGHGLTSHQSQRGNNLIHATGIDRFYIRCLILSLPPPPPSRL